MNRREATETIYEVINGDLIDTKITDPLVDICNRICEDDMTIEAITEYGKIVNILISSGVFFSDLLISLKRVEKCLINNEFEPCRYSVDNEYYWRYCEGCKFLKFTR